MNSRHLLQQNKPQPEPGITAFDYGCMNCERRLIWTRLRQPLDQWLIRLAKGVISGGRGANTGRRAVQGRMARIKDMA